MTLLKDKHFLNNTEFTITAPITANNLDTALPLSAADIAALEAILTGQGVNPTNTRIIGTLVSATDIEIVYLANPGTGVLISRGKESTAVAAFATGDTLDIRPTAGLFADIASSLETLEAAGLATQADVDGLTAISFSADSIVVAPDGSIGVNADGNVLILK